MKKGAILLSAFLAVCGAREADAAAYASLIRVGTTAVPSATGTSISYVLNEAATSVTIEILDQSNAVVATFAGTTAIGLNTVAWNGRVDNAAGAFVADGNNNKVRITTAKTAPAGYVQITSQGHVSSSPAPAKTAMVDHAYPKALVVQNDQTSDQFGTVLVAFGYASYTPPTDAGAWMVLNSALDIVAGDNGYASRVLKHPTDDGTPPVPYDTAVWGGVWDGDRFYAVGQSDVVDGGVIFMSGLVTNGVFPAFTTDADPTGFSGAVGTIFPRFTTISTVSGNKYLFTTVGSGQVIASAVTDGSVTSAIPNILALTTTGLYSKQARFDSAGNMYFVGRRTGAGVGGRVFRWSAAQVAAAIAGGGSINQLTEANAQWDLTCVADPGEAVAVSVTFTPSGDVIYWDSDTGLYNIGNISTSSLVGNLPGTGTQILPAAGILNGSSPSETTSEVVSDAFGNLYLVDGGAEVVQSISPGGNSNTVVSAPPSQTFAIGGSSVDSWIKY